MMLRRPQSQPITNRYRSGAAFSLVELVMVVTIIGIISAIAVPRISGSATSATRTALRATVESVRTAIDVYYAEHGKYPGYTPGTTTPSGTEFVQQLIKYSNTSGAQNATYSSLFLFGPYLRAPFPTNPFNQLNTVHVKATPSDPDPAADAVGWVAVLSHGYFGIHASDSVLDDGGLIDIKSKQAVRMTE